MTSDEPLSSTDINNNSCSMLQRTRSQDMVDDHHNHIVDEDPLLISQSLTYVTDDGSVLHSFRSSPFSMGKSVFVYSILFFLSQNILFLFK